MGRYMLLWLLGVPIPILVLIWLFGGLHRIDFTAWMRARPVWDIIVLIMLLGGLALTTTGLYLAVRRVRDDVVALFRFAARRGTVPEAAPSNTDPIDV